MVSIEELLPKLFIFAKLWDNYYYLGVYCEEFMMLLRPRSDEVVHCASHICDT